MNKNNIQAATEDLNKATIGVGDQTKQALPTTPTITFDFERLSRDIRQNEAKDLDDLIAKWKTLTQDQQRAMTALKDELKLELTK